MNRREQSNIGNIIYWAVGALFIFTMLSFWLVSGLFARYVVSDNVNDAARVANSGSVDIWEHKAEETYENSGVYELLKGDNNLTKNNTYAKVLPGVDIPKDPFVRLELENTEVDYVLYLEVTRSDPFPDHINYEITTNWKELKTEGNTTTYFYVDSSEDNEPYVFDAGQKYDDIPILKDDILYIGQYYFGDIPEFILSFSAYIEQVD